MNRRKFIQNTSLVATGLSVSPNSTGFMHEAFHKDHPEDFNRSWFAWANTLFGELIIKINGERADVLKESLNEKISNRTCFYHRKDLFL